MKFSECHFTVCQLSIYPSIRVRAEKYPEFLHSVEKGNKEIPLMLSILHPLVGKPSCCCHVTVCHWLWCAELLEYWREVLVSKQLVSFPNCSQCCGCSPHIVIKPDDLSPTYVLIGCYFLHQDVQNSSCNDPPASAPPPIQLLLPEFLYV